jgi:hypothetical protein
MPPSVTGSASFSYIEKLQGEAPYGRLLDAGTGPRSLRWLTTLNTDGITAVTGAPNMAAQVQRLLGDWQRPVDRLLVGNWKDPEFLAGEHFDTVVADHLLGAVEGFAPYFQTALFARLRGLTAKRLYLVGMEPYVVHRPESEGGALIWEIGRYHNACRLLSGQQLYREFPLDWVLAQLRRAGFRPFAARKIPTGYKADFVNGQINYCRPLLKKLADQALGEALIAHGEALRNRALEHIQRHQSLNHAFHYVVAADPV